MMVTLLHLCIFLVTSVTGLREGDTCMFRPSNSPGVCTNIQKCQSAKEDYFSGIQLTFCSFYTNGIPLVCCRDKQGTTQAFTTTTESRPIWGTSSTSEIGNRVSEKKCREYSRGVVEEFEYSPLQLDAETFSISTAKCNYTGVDLIVGGEDAEAGEFPHMAAVGFLDYDDKYKFACGGSLISPRFVVTAGHCTINPSMKKKEPAIVRLGDQNIDSSVNDGVKPIDVKISRVIPHPDYHSPIVYNDLALLQLATDVTFSETIRPACLWNKPNFPGYDKVIAIGWGVVNTITRVTSDELQKVTLSLLENDYCHSLLKNIYNHKWPKFVDSQMCAGELRGGKDTCQGDSGSPLQVASQDNQCIFHIVGITSFGKQCAVGGRPGVYTRISKYLDWIESIVWPGE